MVGRLGHVMALDGIRGIAIAVVVGFHYFHIPAGGFAGVDLFFVLSGFLITTLLLEEHTKSGRIGLLGFYLRRARRLLPALWMLLAIGIGSGMAAMALAGFVYSTNIVGAVSVIHGPLAHLWSLGEEEQFYLLWPLTLGLLLRRRLPAAGLLAGAVVAGAVYRAVMVESGFALHRIYMGPDTHADPILLGCLLAVLRAGGRLPRIRFAGPAGAVLFAVVLVVFQHAQDPRSLELGLPLAEIAGALLIVSALERGGTARLLSVRPVVFLGLISYSLYLWHPMVRTYTPSSVAAVPIAVMIAWLSYRYVEQPFRRPRQPEMSKPDDASTLVMAAAVSFPERQS